MHNPLKLYTRLVGFTDFPYMSVKMIYGVRGSLLEVKYMFKYVDMSYNIVMSHKVVSK